MQVMRAKMKIDNVEVYGGDDNRQENLTFSAVCKSEGYGDDGVDENNSFARWTPSASLTMVINNPDLHGKFEVGQEFYVNFTVAD